MRWNSKVAIAIFLAVGAACVVAVYWGVLQWDESHVGQSKRDAEKADADRVALITLASHPADTFQITPAGLKALNIQTVEVTQATNPEPLRLPGSLLLDPDRLVRIHARFPGELVSLGHLTIEGASPTGSDTEHRPLRYGDKVLRGQILAVVWCKDVGEKKSELVDALSRTKIDRNVLSRLEQATKGAIAQRSIDDAQRAVEADLIDVARAERTLRSWRLTEDEIEEVHREADRIGKLETRDASADRTWAETELRSPINGVIIEKNFNVGDILDPSQDLFKIADLNYVQVLANAYEEDLPILRTLRPDQRIWWVDIKSDPHDVPIMGKFELIGSIIDPTQHAGAVLGWLPNLNGQLSPGEFITATVPLPPDPALVEVPTSALIEEGNSTRIFVETDAGRHEFTQRKIAVAKRGRDRAFVCAEPQVGNDRGTESLTAGERVIVSGGLEIAAEMKALQAAAHERRTAVALPMGRALTHGSQAH